MLSLGSAPSLLTTRTGRGGNLVYLDLDGVAHVSEVYRHPRRGIYIDPRLPGHTLFENVPLLVDALRPFPDVRVVLSTSWVANLGFARTLKRLPLQLRHRVVGATFHSLYMRRADWDRVPRGYQILGDVERRRPAHWVALDDDDAEWPEEQRCRLVRTDRILGLRREGALEELIAHLRTWSASEKPRSKE